MTTLDHHHHHSHPLSFAASRASADFSSSFSSPLASRARPVSEIIFNHSSPPSSSANPILPRTNPRVDMNASLRRGVVKDRRVHVDGGDNNENPQHVNRLAEQWLSELESYESTLEALTTSSASSTSSSASNSSSASSTGSTDASQTFKSELNAIETWFSCVLSESERTAALYALLQHTTQVQIRFFISVLRQMEMTRLDPAMARVLDSDSREPQQQSTQDQEEPDRRPVVVEKSCNESRAISPIGSEKSASTRPVSIDDLNSSSSSSNSTATPTPTSAKFQFVTSCASRTSAHENLAATMVNTPVSNLTASLASTPNPTDLSVDAQRTLANAEIIANTTAMKLAALSTVNNRILLDSDVRKFRRRNLLEQANVSSGSPAALNPALPSSPFTPLMYSKSGQVVPLPSQGTPSYKPSSVQQQQAFMSPSPATSSSPFEPASGTRGRRWQSQQPGRFDSNIEAAPPLLFSSPGSFQPHTPSKPQSPSVHFQNLGLGFGMGSSPFSDWYNMSSSSPSVSSPVQSTPKTVSKDKSASSQRVRPSTSPSLSTTSTTSSNSSAMSATGTTSQSRDPSSQIPDDSLLDDIPAWLRSLRLHKYTDNLKDLKWEDLVQLSEDQLVGRGVSALGARRKMLKVFEAVRTTKLGSNQNQKDDQLSAGTEESVSL
ncbi:hypothetical protein V1509DRAFT_73517 [Lipomyces kononenkoae]